MADDDAKKEAVTGKPPIATPTPSVTAPKPTTTTKPTVTTSTVTSPPQDVNKPNFSVKTTPSTPVPMTSAENVRVEKEKLHNRIVEIMKQYGNLEANIPLDNEYWNLLNQYRAMG